MIYTHDAWKDEAPLQVSYTEIQSVWHSYKTIWKNRCFAKQATKW